VCALACAVVLACGGEEQRTVVVDTALDRAFSEPIFEAFTAATGIVVKAAYDTGVDQDHRADQPPAGPSAQIPILEGATASVRVKGAATTPLDAIAAHERGRGRPRSWAVRDRFAAEDMVFNNAF
jgi:hypothetical protein